jgi:A/G-specific adenine glycosylase
MPNKHIYSIPFEPRDFQKALLTWYGSECRELPWRAKPGQQPDPYAVWLSEIMLQQTTVKAVIPYFEAFLAKWPTIDSLGAAPRDEVLAAWAGLGYYARARNLHACAQAVAGRGFPTEEAELLKLPGIGAYTAAAIAAIAFNRKAAAVDGNVERVVARIFSLSAPLPQAKPVIQKIAAGLTPSRRPGDYAQALMDLGATICTPRSPSCQLCPMRHLCSAFASGQPERYPVKAPKAARPSRRGDAFILIARQDGRTSILLRRRPDKGLLGGMFEVPCTEWSANGGSEFPDAFHEIEWSRGHAVQHTFTHFHLELRVFAADLSTIFYQGSGDLAPHRYSLEQACEKTSLSRKNSAVMGALDAAIREKHRTFNMLRDGRVKPGHDNGGALYFIHSLAGGNPSEVTFNSKDLHGGAGQDFLRLLLDGAGANAGEWAPLDGLANFGLPSVMKKAVASGVRALKIELPNAHAAGNPVKSASSVSRVERSARPSTRAGRK